MKDLVPSQRAAFLLAALGRLPAGRRPRRQLAACLAPRGKSCRWPGTEQIQCVCLGTPGCRRRCTPPGHFLGGWCPPIPAREGLGGGGRVQMQLPPIACPRADAMKELVPSQRAAFLLAALGRLPAARRPRRQLAACLAPRGKSCRWPGTEKMHGVCLGTAGCRRRCTPPRRFCWGGWRPLPAREGLGGGREGANAIASDRLP